MSLLKEIERENNIQNDRELALRRQSSYESTIEDDEWSEGSSVVSSTVTSTIGNRDHGKIELESILKTSRANEFKLRDLNDLHDKLSTCVTEIWPRKASKMGRSNCFRQKVFDVGLSFLPCSKGIACSHMHDLRDCNKGKDCENEKCTFIHPKDIEAILNADVKLNELITKSGKEKTEEGSVLVKKSNLSPYTFPKSKSKLNFFTL